MTNPLEERGLQLPVMQALAVVAAPDTGRALLRKSGFDDVEQFAEWTLSPGLDVGIRERLLELGALGARATEGLAATAGRDSSTTVFALVHSEGALLTILAAGGGMLVAVSREELRSYLWEFVRTADEGGAAWALGRYAGEHALTLARTGADYQVAADNPGAVPTTVPEAMERLLAF